MGVPNRVRHLMKQKNELKKMIFPVMVVAQNSKQKGLRKLAKMS